MKKFLAFLLAFALALPSFSNTAHAAEMATRPKDGVTEEQPFSRGTGGSWNFRIPCLVSLDDGTIVAACDARWTWLADAGGLDTIVSRSTDYGKTWKYTFANYFGDNGNVANRNSTAFIDPALATDGKTVYMIADLFPAGYAINSAAHYAVAGQNGLTEDGKLRLAKVTEADVNKDGTVSHEERIAETCNYNAYYLEKASENVSDNDEEYYVIKNAQGNTVEGYSVDAYFNIKGKDTNTNLFLADTPFLTYPTDYLYMTKSEDGGATWSIPTLINAKVPTEQTLLVGPGNGIVTSEGRIIFTAYNYTNGYQRTTVIYSDDEGKTWTRGENIPDRSNSGTSINYESSEATVAEADGKLYMFTRRGNAYYVSEDWGKSWVRDDKGDIKKFAPEINYCWDTQLSVTPYSKKIDGKTALIFSAPSTYRRNAGKIYVGLIQEDGSIEWPYEYSVNEQGDWFAYSCIAELKDGSIGLLYEGKDNEGDIIIFDRFPIEEVAKGAVVSDFWLTNEQGEFVNDLKMGSHESVQLYLKNATVSSNNVSGNHVPVSTNDLTLTSSNEEIVQARVEDGVIIITADEVGDHLYQEKITVTNGSSTFEIRVNATNAEKFEVVNLGMGISTDYVDETGDYSDTLLNDATSIVDITLKGVSVESELQLATGLTDNVSQFNGDNKDDLRDALYTFTKSGEGRFVISGTTAQGEAIYLNIKGGSAGIPSSTNSAVIQIAERQNDDSTFSLMDTASGSVGGYLYFHTDKYRFDRNGAIAEGNCHFEIYKEGKNAESEIKGYTKVNDVSEIEDGDKCLIVKKGADEEYYCLYPYKGGSNYNHVAKLVDLEQPVGKTDINFKGIAEGEGQITIGNTTYYITVENEEASLTLKVGEGFAVRGKLIHEEEGQEIVEVEENSGFAPYVSVTTIKPGSYLFGNANYMMINEASASTEHKGIAMTRADYQNGQYHQYLWTLEEAEGGYTMKDVTGKYLTFSGGNNVELSDESQVLTITNSRKGGFAVSHSGTYLNNWAGSNSDVAGYPSDDNAWSFYEPTGTGYMIYGAKEGTTEVVLSGTEYHITVSGIILADYGRVEAALQEVPTDLTKYTQATVDALNEAKDAVVQGLDVRKQDIVDGYAQAIREAIENLEFISFTVKFEDADGTPIYTTEEVAKDGKIIEPQTPEKEGYKFLGWYVDGEKYDFTTPVTKDITLTAQWEKITTPEEPGVSDNEPGVSDNEPGVSDNEPGVSDNDPSASDNDPGVSDNDPEVSGYENIWVEGLEDKVYTGSKITQQLKLYDGDKLLIEGADYTVSYKNNINACEFTAEELEAFEEAYRKDPKTKANIGSIPSKKAPQVVLKMKGNYTGTRSLFFQIEKQDIADEGNFILDDLTVTNTGKDKTPVPVVTWKYNGKNLKNKKDFTVEQKTEATGTVLVVKGNGNFKGEKEISYVITPDKNTIAMDQVKVTKLTAVDYKEDGSLKPTGFTVKYKKATLKEGTHFEVSEVSANDIMGNGTATVVLTAKEGATEAGYNFVGSKRVSFKVNTYSLSKVKATGLVAQTFTGDDINPLSMTDGNGNPVVNLTIPATKTMAAKTLTADDYTVTYEKNVSKGTASLTLTGVPERGVTGSKKLTFKINPTTLSEGEGSGFDVTVASDVSGNDNTVYHTKGGAKPAVTIVRQDGQLLVEGRDYTVAYKANKGPGQGQAIVKGKGNYTGQLSLSYTIEKKPVSEEDGNGVWIQVNDKVYNTKKNSWKQSFKVLDSDGKALANKKDADIKGAVYTVYSLPAEAPEGIKVGDTLSDANTVLPEGAEVQITVTMAGSYEGKVTGIYRIINKDKDISKAKFQLRPQQYTGEAVIIDGNDDFAKRDLKGTTLSMEEGQTFEVVEGSYINNIKKGTAKVTLRGVGEYGGIKTVTFKIGARSVTDWFDTEFQYWN